jgi:hypothetical protein
MSLISKIKRILQIDYSSVLLPWFWLDSDELIANNLHRLAIEQNTQKASILKIFCYAIIWPIVSCWRAIYFVRLYGNFVCQTEGFSLFSQWKQIVYLANIYNLEPESYYKFKLWRAPNRSKTNLYLQQHEITQLLPQLNRNIDVAKVRDKINFFNTCRTNGLPAIPVIVQFEKDGKEQWYTDSASLPDKDLFIKYTDLYCGVGAERWEYLVEQNSWQRHNKICDRHEMIDRCRNLAKKRAILVQPCLKNHPKMADFSQIGLCTVRVVTYRLPDSQPEILLSSLRMPVGKIEVDNFAAGGIAAGISNEGKLTVAVGKDIRKGTFVFHPDTQAPIAGAELPHWRDIFDLAISAHKVFGEPYFIGWDIALTAEGAILVEGNTTWCVDLLQMSHDRPLLETPFAKIFSTLIGSEIGSYAVRGRSGTM